MVDYLYPLYNVKIFDVRNEKRDNLTVAEQVVKNVISLYFKPLYGYIGKKNYKTIWET